MSRYKFTKILHTIAATKLERSLFSPTFAEKYYLADTGTGDNGDEASKTPSLPVAS